VVYVAGNLPVLGPWHPAALEMKGTGTTRTAQISVPHDHTLQYKITAGSWEQEGLGPSATLLPSFTAKITEPASLTAEIAGFRKDPRELISNWRGSDVEGELKYWMDMPSKFLKEDRHVVTWLPPGYDAQSGKTYKVIYMHDAQNLFDPRLSYTNVDWGVDEAMMKGVRAGHYEPAIIVGIWNTPDRLKEYSPDHLGKSYTRFIIEELMPKVETAYNVKTGPENTFSMGSSMGGLISFHLVRNHPDVFSACGCVSTHVTWSEQQIAYFNGGDPTNANPIPYVLRSISNDATMPAGQRLYFDYGTKGLDAQYDFPTKTLAQWLGSQGYVEGDNLKVKVFEGDDHNETAWRARVGEHLDWLLREQN
ncbi:MAG: alpha/beta hydrolase-fold protein, partial [Gammaproteobacteria bacterium]